MTMADHDRPAERTLILLRHGKSDYPGGVVDHERPLAPRGRREAALAGIAIRERVTVTQVICSAATRARETLAATGIDAPVSYTDAIYEASPGEILEALGDLSEEFDVVLVVGHSPGMPATTLTLADAESDPAVLADVQAHFPTSAFAVLRVHGTWADLAGDGATLAELVIPRA
jgi:phosphohistidine phosphatase